jgi:apolipoprotein N-acyltransferase
MPCPHCGLETILFVPPSPTSSIIPIPKRKSGGRKWILLALAVVIVAISFIWCLSTVPAFLGFVTGCIVFLLILAVGLAIYFLPLIIAISARRKNVMAIFVVNFFLGWTLIGWVVALAWAAMEDNPK